MQDEKYESRKEYINRIRESFNNKEDKDAESGFRDRNSVEEEEMSENRRSYWKLRLLVSVLCFIAFFMVRQTGWHNQWISEKQIVSQIQKNYDLEVIKQNLQRFPSFFNKDR